MPLELVEELTRVNWLGTVYTVRAGLPGMLERRRGHIVIVSSGAGLRAFPHAAVYGATKAAQRGFAEALRHELEGTGVSLTIVYPGQIRTALHDHEKERMPDWYRLERAAAPEGLARSVVEGVEKDRREVFYPPSVRLLRMVHGLRPGRPTRCCGGSCTERRAVTLPLKPPVKPQLASSAGPARGRGLVLRAQVGRLPDDRVPRRRRRPSPKPQRAADEPLLPRRGRAGVQLPAERLVVDGEMVVMVDGIQEFDLLSQRIHPAASRVEMLAQETPAASWPSTCSPRATRCCSSCPTASAASGSLR